MRANGVGWQVGESNITWGLGDNSMSQVHYHCWMLNRLNHLNSWNYIPLLDQLHCLSVPLAANFDCEISRLTSLPPRDVYRKQFRALEFCDSDKGRDNF